MRPCLVVMFPFHWATIAGVKWLSPDFETIATGQGLRGREINLTNLTVDVWGTVTCKSLAVEILIFYYRFSHSNST